jgi:IS30 family transposase
VTTLNNQQKDATQKLRKEGKSYTVIASFLGISENTIKSYCRRNNLGGFALVAPESVSATYCRQCGTSVKQTSGKKQKHYCSDKCRMAWWNAHPETVTRKNVQHFTCETCGETFEGYGKRDRKYCSRACYGKAKAVRHE